MRWVENQSSVMKMRWVENQSSVRCKKHGINVLLVRFTVQSSRLTTLNFDLQPLYLLHVILNSHRPCHLLLI